jgi:hypothetical protein
MMMGTIRLVVAVWFVWWQSLALAQLDAPTTLTMTNVSDAKPVAAVTPSNATEPEHMLLPAMKKVRGFNKRARGHGLDGELPPTVSKGASFLSSTGNIRSMTGAGSSSPSKGGSKHGSKGGVTGVSKGPAAANTESGSDGTTNSNTVDNSEGERSSGVVSKCTSVANATLVTGRTRVATYQMELHVIAAAGEAGSMRYKLRSALQRQVAPYLTSCEAPLRTNMTRVRRLVQQHRRVLLNGVINVVFRPLQVKDIRTYSDRRRVVFHRDVSDRSPSIRADLLLLLPQGTVRIRRG